MNPNAFPALDLNIHHGVYKQRDVMVWLSWLLTDGEACLVLTPANKPAHHERIRPSVVTQDTAWKWDEDRGEASYADVMAAEFATNLGMDPLNRSNVIRVQGIIRDFLQELIEIPPLPDQYRQKVADMIVTDRATGTVTHKEITDYV